MPCAKCLSTLEGATSMVVAAAGEADMGQRCPPHTCVHTSSDVLLGSCATPELFGVARGSFATEKLCSGK